MYGDAGGPTPHRALKLTMCTSNELRLRLGSLVTRFAEEVGRLAEENPTDSCDPGLSELTRHLGLLMAGASSATLITVRAGVVGFGSRVVLEDLASGASTTHHVMASSAMDFDADHLSVESPFGAAIVGSAPGAVVEVRTPQGHKRVRIVELQTLLELIDLLEPRAEDLLKLQANDVLAGALR